MNAADRRLANEVEHRARLVLYNAMSPEQQRGYRNWLDRAAAYKERHPDASLDEVRAAVRALRDVPMDPYAQISARVTEQQANSDLERICSEVRSQHHKEMS